MKKKGERERLRSPEFNALGYEEFRPLGLSLLARRAWRVSQWGSSYILSGQIRKKRGWEGGGGREKPIPAWHRGMIYSYPIYFTQCVHHIFLGMFTIISRNVYQYFSRMFLNTVFSRNVHNTFSGMLTILYSIFCWQLIWWKVYNYFVHIIKKHFPVEFAILS